jgi:maltose alpha-D-glucosyltransferase/alpha-amylase
VEASGTFSASVTAGSSGGEAREQRAWWVARTSTLSGDDPDWFRTAVFYEVLVRAFADSTGSGTGDFTGLIGKLDYLQWLGVDCLWIPPFYASPLRDGGYDIADYRAVLPEFGTVQDFRELVAQAHARGIRIITDFVMNHTSDRTRGSRPRAATPTGPYGDFYVWSDTDDPYAGTRIIFVDTEASNWTFDPVRGQFFWHRFFSHQPDLNFENPAVTRPMFDVVRFWMDMGIDGFRLDAVPYLFEEEGHSGENHPKTHAFLAQIARDGRPEYPGRILLAEANQPPAEVVDYFGTRRPRSARCASTSRSCRCSTTRCAASARRRSSTSSRTPRRSRRAPSGAPSCATTTSSPSRWSRQEQRAAMYGWYAPDPRMRANVGIRRRLCVRCWTTTAPSSSSSTPSCSRCPARPASTTATRSAWATTSGCPTGTPPHPDAVDARPQRRLLHRRPGQALPPGHRVPRVPPQPHERRSTDGHRSSLLHWVRGMLAVRREHPVFGIGDFEICASVNDRVLSFVRVDRSERDKEDRSAMAVLCVNNLSSRPQATTVTIPDELRGWETRDLFGGGGFPDIADDGTVTITLGSRDFFWLALDPPRGDVRG